ncbi:hypothetical protein PMKS-003534 [Pichia membranifaciens]|uniref:Methyltransferase type 11 domain-containing protein n=1 Tax=Pichia membranifaciens TaxID=4926 RepID=A0A1Q2YKE1_9ASCO|nr:hypothetical protein PMKS-003534 [Pichia membranifaciens]
MSEPHYTACQYGERANDYVSSIVHSTGADLDFIEKQVVGKKLSRVLDLGCGGGHVSYRIAPHVCQVIACDVTKQMLESVREEAVNRHIPNIQTIHASAEKLPFQDRYFDAVFCRFTTHHWSDVVAALREIKRVLVPSASAIFIDVISPVSPLADTWLQTLELLRDISHVRDYSIAEWTSLLGKAENVSRSEANSGIVVAFTTWNENKPVDHHRAVDKSPNHGVSALGPLLQNGGIYNVK